MTTNSITLAIAITGAVTGILGLIFNFLSTWRTFDRDRVKLKVVQKWAIFSHPVLGSQDTLCVEVTNLGFIPVTLSRVVFPIDGSNEELHFTPHPMSQEKLPKRLEPRESVTVYTEPDLVTSAPFGRVSSARAWTACGRKIDGTSPALKTVAARLRKGLPA